jgi:hypothetical protein
VPSLLVMGISLVLFLGHMLGLGAAERARPLGRAPRAPEETAAPVRAPAR